MVGNKLILVWLVAALAARSVQAKHGKKGGNRAADISGSGCKGKKCSLDKKPSKYLFTKSDIVLSLEGEDGDAVDLDFVAQTFQLDGVAANDGDYIPSFYGTSGENAINMVADTKGNVYGSITTQTEIIQLKGNGDMVSRDIDSFPDETSPLNQKNRDNIFKENARRNLAMSMSMINSGHASGNGLRGAANDTLSSYRRLQDTTIAIFDIMVVWTARAECSNSELSHGCILTETTSDNMLGLINLAIFETNVAFSASGVYAQVRLVHAYRGDYTETSGKSDFNDALNDITGKNDGKLDEVHAKRIQYGADLVSLIIDGDSYCGIAWLGPKIDVMFSVADWSCATGYYSFGHEIAHNLVRTLCLRYDIYFFYMMYGNETNLMILTCLSICLSVLIGMQP
jgi:hypothetical protein